MATPQLTVSLTHGGTTVTRQESFTTDNDQTTGPLTLATGKAGTLTTRTDDNTGVITVESGHGITDTDFVAVGWTDASGNLVCRFYMTVTGTTATTISVDGGTGANFPVASTAVVVGIVTSEPFHIDPAADTVDLQKPVTAFCVTVNAAGQKAACLLGVDSAVTVGTFTNVRLVTANGVSLPSILFGDIGSWNSFPGNIDRIYFAPLSATAPVVTAKTMFNS